jgi:DNA-binding Lrp family transcriptional regulator
LIYPRRIAGERAMEEAGFDGDGEIAKVKLFYMRMSIIANKNFLVTYFSYVYLGR